MDAAGSAFARLVAVMDRLRSPGGCPWDAAQTHASLAPYAVEEAYEVVEAAEAGDLPALREELGDLLLQVVFHARVAQEDAEAPFDVVDVVDDLVAKLVRRHPHVFADADASGPAEVEAAWRRIKDAEKRRDGLLRAGQRPARRAGGACGRHRRGRPAPRARRGGRRRGRGRGRGGGAARGAGEVGGPRRSRGATDLTLSATGRVARRSASAPGPWAIMGGAAARGSSDRSADEDRRPA